MGPKVSEALKCIESRGEMVRAELIRSGISVEKSLEIVLDDLKRRRPRLRHKKDKEELEINIRVLNEAIEEVRKAQQAKPPQAGAGK
jgi:prefoldin subunit 5